MFRRPIDIITTVAAVTVILVFVNAAYSIYWDYESTVVEHEVMARDLTSVVADQAARSVRDTDRALIQIGEMIQSGGLQVFESKEEWDWLHRIADWVPGGTGILIADPGGNVVASSVSRHPVPTNVAERDYAKVLAERDILHVGAAVKSTLDHNEVIYTISRRVSDRQGNFLGIVSAGVHTNHLTEFYDLFGFKKDPGIAVFRENGEIIARRPDIKDFIGKNIGHRPLFQVRLKHSPEGVFRARSPMDGIDRINAYKQVGATGLVVLVGIPWETVTAGWRDRTWQTAAIAFMSGIAIIAAALWGDASLRRVLQAERTLAGEQMARQRMRTFVDMATHEFKTPLAVIDSAAQMLELVVDKDRDGIHRRLTHIRKSVRRMTDLIETCLVGARIDDEYPVRVMSFVPAAFIQGIVDRQCDQGEAALAVDMSGLPAHWIADPDLLGIALDALIDNARRYGPADAVIDVKARQDGRSLIISVSDRGPGIAEDEVARVFEKYYRGTHTRDIPGTGIGLDLVKTIAELHGGDIAYRNRDGGGAAFILSIPLSPLNGMIEVRQVPAEGATEPSPITGLNILLVEDDPLVRETTRDLLTWHGAIVTTVSDGQDAADACRGGGACDVVLMDVNIPGMNGLEATRRIRAERGNALPIIGLSANAQPSAREDALASGMTEYLPKPIDAIHLIAAISACMHRDGGRAMADGPPASGQLLIPGRIAAMRDIYSPGQLAGYAALFERQVGTDLDSIHSAFAAHDRAAMAAAAHRLAGAAAHFGCGSLAAAAQPLAHPQAAEGWEAMADAITIVTSIAPPTIEALKVAFTGDPSRAS